MVLGAEALYWLNTMQSFRHHHSIEATVIYDTKSFKYSRSVNNFFCYKERKTIWHFQFRTGNHLPFLTTTRTLWRMHHSPRANCGGQCGVMARLFQLNATRAQEVHPILSISPSRSSIVAYSSSRPTSSAPYLHRTAAVPDTPEISFKSGLPKERIVARNDSHVSLRIPS